MEIETIKKDEKTFIEDEIHDYIETQTLRREAADEITSLLSEISGLLIRHHMLNDEVVEQAGGSSPVKVIRESQCSIVVCAGTTERPIFAIECTPNQNARIATDYAFPPASHLSEAGFVRQLLDHYGFEVSRSAGSKWFESTMVVYQAQEVLVKLLLALAGRKNASDFLEEN